MPLIQIDLSIEEVEQLESAVGCCGKEGYDMTQDWAIIAKLRAAIQAADQPGDPPADPGPGA